MHTTISNLTNLLWYNDILKYKKITYTSYMKKIAVIGWGSLIWQPNSLKKTGEWNEDGPTLPLEFCRISADGRVTLVLDKNGTQCKALWALMDIDNFDDAVENLRAREGTVIDMIHFHEKNSELIFPHSEIILEWMIGKDLDAVIWTGLETNWSEKRQVNFSIEDLEVYLEEKISTSSGEKIIEYFINAPTSIKTPGRKCFDKIHIK